jgi:TRIAD3 protein (E3 ubiquitin-protein ligase RNF216)
MDEDGCEALFNESEALKFLPPASIALLHKVRQEKEIEEAALEGLENCPSVPSPLCPPEWDWWGE